MLRTRLFVAILLACTGCSSGSATQTTTPTRQSAEPAAGHAGYEVHEWGLLRAGAGDVLSVSTLASPPRVRMEVLTVDKPVLYFHVDAPLTLRSVRVATPGGSILETWPYVSGSNVAIWENVRLAHEDGCTPSPLPESNEMPCASLAPEVICESPGLDITRTTDAASVRVGSATERFLFYRAEARTYTPPLRFTRRADGEIDVSNEGDAAIPGVIVRILQNEGHVQAWMTNASAPHATSVLGRSLTSDSEDEADRPVAADQPALIEVEAGRDGIRRSMTELGLTSTEIDAFMRAWDATLFGASGAVDGLSGQGDAAPTETVLYFLPPTSLDGIATLTFDPAPRAVHRALALWTALPRQGSSR